MSISVRQANSRKRILFLSNGHGEDLNASLVVKALRQASPDLEIAAMPLVGDGDAYRKLAVPIIGPTQKMPSGGIFYMSPISLLKDLWSGLIGLTLEQIQAVWRCSQTCDLLVAVGDIVPISMARLTAKPFAAFIVSTSSYYEGQIKLPWITARCLRSQKCQQIFTRDAYTAQDLQARGFHQATFAGYPVMDVLSPTGVDLNLIKGQPMVALMPGSRLPEALNNFARQLQLCEAIAADQPIQFRATLVPSIQVSDLAALATDLGWQFQPPHLLSKPVGRATVSVHCYSYAFADILQQCDLAIGMAGTAVEQAVGLGKPVIQIPGAGPQFTYRFAEAQMRLLGSSVQTVGTVAATPAVIQQAARQVIETLQDDDYRQTCVENGRERVGRPGGSAKIAHSLQTLLLGKGDDTMRPPGSWVAGSPG
jgi:uncharacterized protein (TIGR03492 family)